MSSAKERRDAPTGEREKQVAITYTESQKSLCVPLINVLTLSKSACIFLCLILGFWCGIPLFMLEYINE